MADAAKRFSLLEKSLFEHRTLTLFGEITKDLAQRTAEKLLCLSFESDDPITMMQTDFAVYIGIVYSYLPFMILPLYANLERLDRTLLEAAADLGCRPMKAFFTITLPLSIPGIAAGSMLVFIPAVGEFVIPALLGGPDTLMIGRVLWDEFFANRDWPVASAVAIVVLLLLLVPIMIFQHIQAGEAGAR